MKETIYVVTRWYENDGFIVECFKNKEKALEHAKSQALEDHQYFECQEDFESCCYTWDKGSEIWSYESPVVSIGVLESKFMD